jgi:hypothetical protein
MRRHYFCQKHLRVQPRRNLIIAILEDLYENSSYWEEPKPKPKKITRFKGLGRDISDELKNFIS